MRPFLSLSLVLLFLAIAGCKYVPVENVEEAPLLAPEEVTLDRVKKGIVRAGEFQDWEMTEVEPGHIVGRLIVRGKHTAAVDILFDTKVFSIRYKDSGGLDYDGETIHQAYNTWVFNLKRDIQKEMKLIGVKG